MNSLQQLDSRLTDLRDAFSQVAQGLAFEYVCSLANEKTIATQTYAGIYLIELRTSGPHRELAPWYDSFKTDWEHPRFKEKFTPNTKKKRIKAHTSLAEWMPLYVGKSKRVASRVWEHINLDLHAKTFALKLAQRPTLKLRDMRLSTINLDKFEVKNYGLVAPALELAMRDRLNPIVGRQ